MTVSFDIPDRVASALACSNPDIARATKEAALVELYRQGKLSHHELGEALGLSRFEVDALLKRHNVPEDPITAGQSAADIGALRKLDHHRLRVVETNGDTPLPVYG